MNIAPSKNIEVHYCGDELSENQKTYIKKLGKVEEYFRIKIY